MKNFKIIKVNNKKILNNFLINYFKEIDFKKNEKNDLKIKKFLKINIKTIFYLLINQDKIGFLAINLYKNLNGKNICLIKDFFIEKKYRKKSYGIKFIKVLSKSLKKKKIYKCKIEVLSSNQSVLNFWKKFKIKKISTNYIFKT